MGSENTGEGLLEPSVAQKNVRSERSERADREKEGERKGVCVCGGEDIQVGVGRREFSCLCLVCCTPVMNDQETPGDEAQKTTKEQK